MALTNDVLLNGVAYSLVPGSYTRRNQQPAGLPQGRLVLGPFGRGQRQAIEPTPEPVISAGWDSAGVGPAFDGAGVEPWPNSTSFDDSTAMQDTPTTTNRAHGVIAGTSAFIGLGRRIYKSVALSNGTWAALTVAVDLGAGFVISGLAYYQDDLLVMLSSGQDIRKFNTATNAVTIWRTGEKGQVGAGYAGQLIYAPKLVNAQEELRLSGTKWNGNAVTHTRFLDSPIVSMALFNGRVAIATKTSLYFMAGQPYPGEADDAAVSGDTSKAPEWRGDPQSVMTHGAFAEADDFIFLASYRGRLYTWLGGRAAEFDDSQEQGRWLRMGPEGLACYGATVAGDWLVVAIAARNGNKELWAFDGQGWWLIQSDSTTHVWPFPLGGAGNRELGVFRDASETYDLYRLKWRSASVHAYGATGAWTSSLIDVGDPSREKSWRAVGATFAAPAQRGNAGSVDSVTVSLEYSLNAGVSWTQAATMSVNDPATLTRDLRSAFAVLPQSRYLQLRVGWSSISDWAPVLSSVWADYDVRADSSVKRRRWELTVDAGDRGVRRDAQRDPQAGRQKSAALWQAWELGTPLTFRDVDHDTDAVWTAADLPATDQPRLWLDPALSASSHLEPVPLWPDISGVGNHAVGSAVPAEWAQLRTNQINGKPVVWFDGTNDFYECALSASSQDEAWIGVFLPDTNGLDRTILGSGTAGARQIRHRSAAGDLQYLKQNTAAIGDSLETAAAAVPVIMGGSLGGTTWTTRINGTQSSGVHAQTLTAGLTTRIGRGNPGEYYVGGIGMLLVGRLWSVATFELLEGWLAHSFGLAANLPAPHPYKAAPPAGIVDYAVFIDEIAETVGKPSDAGRWGESRLELKLSQV